CSSRGSNLHVHFKDTCELARAFKGVHIRKAPASQKDVPLLKSRSAFSVMMVELAGAWPWIQHWWPKKSTEILLYVLKNADSNA
ncbi:hypothetical protein DBR06_SOUSAS18810029, partial [Sousa chinensis]